MKLRRILAILLRYCYLLKGSPQRLVSLYIWVTISMFIWGFISRYLNSVASTGFSFVPAFLGAVLLSDFMTRVALGIVTTFLEDVWARNFLNLFASPLRAGEYLVALVISGIVSSFIGLILMVFCAAPLFGLDPFVYGVTIVPLLLILFMSGIALGILGIALVMRLGPSSEWLVWPIPAIIGPFVGIFYPVSTLPHWMQIVASGLPPTYVFEGMRTILSGGHITVDRLAIGLGLSAFYIVLSCCFFLSTFRRAIRSGIIARYSAENAG